MRKWWEKLNSVGPKFGYYPKPSKTFLIVKDASSIEKAKEVFGNTGITITTEGERHLGAAIGSEEFRTQYIENKVNNWIKDVEQLSKIAVDEPQLALSAFTKALCMRWSHLQRTIPGISHFFEPLEEAICEKFIPAVVGRKLDGLNRRIVGQPVRFGGLGILNPVVTADNAYLTSEYVTQDLVDLIIKQDVNLERYDTNKVKEKVLKTKSDKEKLLKEEYEELLMLVNEDMKRNLELATEKGAGAWLTALPVQAYGGKTTFFCTCPLRNNFCS